MLRGRITGIFRTPVGLVGASLLVIGAADATLYQVRLGLPLQALFDEPAHVATTILLVVALGWLGRRDVVIGAVVASVAIDLDHLPQYLGTQFLTDGTPRPYTHSLMTIVAVAVLALVLRGRRRHWLLAAELGLIGHLFRDMAEPGSHAGVALLWPVSDANFRLPYLVYAISMSLLAVAGIARRRLGTAGGAVPHQVNEQGSRGDRLPDAGRPRACETSPDDASEAMRR